MQQTSQPRGPFAFEVTENVSVEAVEVEKRFSATLKVYTSKNVKDVEGEFMEFFEILDADQSFENFVKELTGCTRTA